MKRSLLLAALSFSIFSCADNGAGSASGDSTVTTSVYPAITDSMPGPDTGGTGNSTGEGTTTSGTSTGSSSSHTTDTSGHK